MRKFLVLTSSLVYNGSLFDKKKCAVCKWF